jgi:hypothetical protein
MCHKEHNELDVRLITVEFIEDSVRHEGGRVNIMDDAKKQQTDMIGNSIA